jgi:hypothetical protein
VRGLGLWLQLQGTAAETAAIGSAGGQQAEVLHRAGPERSLSLDARQPGRQVVEQTLRIGLDLEG